MPDYRLSIEEPYPAALNDAYLALKWLHDNTDQLGVNPQQLCVVGDSAGGGLTAALTLYARDQHEVNIAFQSPMYPMLDDRPTASSANNDAPVWNTNNNQNAWKLYLGNDYGTHYVSQYAAPARAVDYRNLPPTYTFVGTIEPFYDETLTYIDHLKKAGVPASLDIYEGGFHALDLFGGKTRLGKEATKRWQQALKYASENYFCEET